MFSPFNSGKANLGCDTNLASNLISSCMRSMGFNKGSVSLWESLTET